MLNDHSSRSHLVTTIYMEKKEKKNKNITVSLMNLVDLAGSERVSKTEVTGRRLEEAQSINKSVFYLLVLVEFIRRCRKLIRKEPASYSIQKLKANNVIEGLFIW